MVINFILGLFIFAFTHEAIEIDFIKNLKCNALGPQVVIEDSFRNRVFAACANSSAVAVLGEARFNIPIGSRMPVRLRKSGLKVSPENGKLYICGDKKLIVVDPNLKTSKSFSLNGDYETIALDPENQFAYLAGRTCSDLAVVNGSTGETRYIPFAEKNPALTFMAASAPPPIRFLVVDEEMVYVVDGCESMLYGINKQQEKVLFSSQLPVGSFPRWHMAGFDKKSKRIFVCLENVKREAKHALAIDVLGKNHRIINIPDKHTEPAGVACDPERAEIYIPYDNIKKIHVASFDKAPELESIDIPDLGVNATIYDPKNCILFALGWKQAALYVTDIKERKLKTIIPFIPVLPHMNNMAYLPRRGELYIPSGSTAVNGTFGAAITVFNVNTQNLTQKPTGWAPVSLIQKPDSENFYVFSSQSQFAEVSPKGEVKIKNLPHPYLHKAILDPDQNSIHVSYGPHSSWWPAYYINGTRTGVFRLNREGEVITNRMIPRLAQNMIFDTEGKLWAFQNTWGNEAPFLITWRHGRQHIPLPPKGGNECMVRLLALDKKTGMIYGVRTGNLNTENGKIYLIDPKTFKVLGDAETGRTPTGLWVDSKRSRIYVCNFDDNTVYSYGKDLKNMQAFDVEEEPLFIDQHHNSGALYVVCKSGLAVLNGKMTPLEGRPNNLLTDQDTGRVYVTSQDSNTLRIYEFDPNTDRLTRLFTKKHPYGEVSFDHANTAFSVRGQWGDCRFKITQIALDHKARLWVTDYLGGKCYIINTPRVN